VSYAVLWPRAHSGAWGWWFAARVSGAVGTAHVFRLDDVPRSITRDEVRCMLEAVERRTIRGRQDYAILPLLVTYGLRRMRS
jgi:hypothetical protein